MANDNKPMVKPGQEVPESGIYREVGPRGGQPSSGETTLVQGKPAPPTSEPGRQWQLDIPTPHKHDK